MLSKVGQALPASLEYPLRTMRHGRFSLNLLFTSRLPVTVWWLLLLVAMSAAGCQPNTETTATVGQPLGSGDLEFEVLVDDANCDAPIRRLLVQVENGSTYEFDIGAAPELSGRFVGVPDAGQGVNLFGLTADGQPICGAFQSYVPATGSAPTLSCVSACPYGPTPPTSSIACPTATISGSRFGFADVPTPLTASTGSVSVASYLWSSPSVQLSSPSASSTDADCPSARGTYRVDVEVANADCASTAGHELKCTDQGATVLLQNNYVPPAVPGELTFPITGALFEMPLVCPVVVPPSPGAQGSWECETLENRLPKNAGKVRCACQWRGNTPWAQLDRLALDNLVGAPNWSPDGPIVGSSSLETELNQYKHYLTDRGRQHLGVTDVLAGAPGSVRVAVIDTTSRSILDPLGVNDNATHGRAVSAIIADAACGEFSEHCAVQVHNYAGLGVLATSSPSELIATADDPDGGNVGTLLGLSEAIVAAVNDWKNEANREDQLIVNLSLAWDPRWTNLEAMRLPALNGAGLVEDALSYASCHGALIFAAAGNSLPQSVGQARATAPMLPAAWTSVPAPSPSDCPNQSPVGSETAPAADWLLHAVGAVDYNDKPLMSSRALPPLAALGYATIRTDPAAGIGHTSLLTGTSVSTAAVSGIAARIWSGGVPGLGDASTLSAAQLMAVLQGDIASRPTETAVTFCPTSTGCGEQMVRAVTLCPADAPCWFDSREGPSQDAPTDQDLATDVTSVQGEGYETPFRPWVVPQPDGDPFCRVCRYADPSDILDASMFSNFNPWLAALMRVHLDNRPYVYWPVSNPADDFRLRLLEAGHGTSHAMITYKYLVGGVWLDIAETLVVTEHQ